MPYCSDGDMALGSALVGPIIIMLLWMWLVYLPQLFGSRGHPEEWTTASLLQRVVRVYMKSAEKVQKAKEKRDEELKKKNPKKWEKQQAKEAKEKEKKEKKEKEWAEAHPEQAEKRASQMEQKKQDMERAGLVDSEAANIRGCWNEDTSWLKSWFCSCHSFSFS